MRNGGTVKLLSEGVKQDARLEKGVRLMSYFLEALDHFVYDNHRTKTRDQKSNLLSLADELAQDFHLRSVDSAQSRLEFSSLRRSLLKIRLTFTLGPKWHAVCLFYDRRDKNDPELE